MTLRLAHLHDDPAWFPPIQHALRSPDGLLAVGGDLTPNRLLQAYRQGIFPWFSEDDPLLWWSPSVRAVFAPNSLVPNRTLRKELRRSGIRFSCNQVFSQVIRECAAPRPTQAGTWIQPNIQLAYIELHRLGVAHSIEVWQDEKLIGGLYGLQIGELFCGESMFNRQPNAAKMALCMLQQHLLQVCDGWIDCQMPNPFLLSQGAQPIPRHDYATLLAALRDQPLAPTHWQARALELPFD